MDSVQCNYDPSLEELLINDLIKKCELSCCSICMDLVKDSVSKSPLGWKEIL